MPDWTDELKASVVSKYVAANPTPENTSEIVKDIADSLGEGFTTNGVRAILVKAEAYVKKDATTATKSEGTKSTRVNKADSIKALWIVLKGCVKELPWFSMLSVASRSLGFTYKIRPWVFLMKLSNLLRGIFLLHRYCVLTYLDNK